MLSKELLEGYSRFYTKQDPELFANLAKNGQRPKIAIVGCIDSRVDPSAIFSARPGEIIVIRNVANLVPPYVDSYDEHHGTSAALEFAVKVLGVDTIMVLGHSQCGGIKHLLNNNEPDASGFLGPWVKIANPAKEKVMADSTLITSDRPRHCEEESIKCSLDNLRTFPFIQKAIEANRLTLVGAYFDIEERALRTYNKQSNRFEEVVPTKITDTVVSAPYLHKSKL